MESLEDSLKTLKLPVLAERFDGWLETAAKQNWTPREFLERVVAEELSEKRGKRTEMGVRRTRFPLTEGENRKSVTHSDTPKKLLQPIWNRLGVYSFSPVISSYSLAACLVRIFFPWIMEEKRSLANVSSYLTSPPRWRARNPRMA